MCKVIKKSWHIFARIIGALIVLFIAANLALLIPGIQTNLSGRILDAIDDNLGGDVSISELHITPFNAIHISGLTVIDREPYSSQMDTIMHIDEVTATLSLKNLFSGGGIHVGRIYVEGALFHLVTQQEGEYPSNLTRFFRHIPNPDKEKKPDPESIFDARKIIVKDFTFRFNAFRNKKRIHKGIGINWQNLDVHVDRVKGHNFKIGGGYYSGVADRIENLSEKSGYFASLVKAKAEVGHGHTLIEDIHVIDNWSDVKGDRFSMEYEFGDQSFKHFETLVTMEAIFRESSLSMRTISYFIDNMKDADVSLDIKSGHIKGPMKNLVIDGFRFDSESLGLSGVVNGCIKGLTQISEVSANIRIDNAQYLFNGNRIHFSGSAKGPINSIQGQLKARSGQGSAQLGVRAVNLLERDPLTLSGEISTDNLDLSGIIRSKIVNEVTASSDFKASISKEHKEFEIEKFLADRISINGYAYSGISASGTFDDGRIEASMESADSNATFKLDGLYDLDRSRQGETGRISADISGLNLLRTKLVKNGEDAFISLSVDASMSRDSAKEESGRISLSDMKYTDISGIYSFGDMDIDYKRAQEESSAILKSTFFDADYSGSLPVEQLFTKLKGLSEGRSVPEFRSRLEFHDTRELMAAAWPGLYIAEGTELTFAVGMEQEITAGLTSQRLAKGGAYLKDISIGAKGKLDSLPLSMSCSAFSINSKDLGESRIDILAAYDDNQWTFNVLPDSSVLKLGESSWSFTPSSVAIKGRDFDFRALSLYCGDQSLLLDGSLSPNGTDTLTIALNGIDLGIAGNLMKNDIGLSGILSGSAVIESPFSKDRTALDSRIFCDSLMVKGSRQGPIMISSRWDEDRGTLYFDLKQNGTRDAVSIGGYFTPSGRELNLDADINGLELSMLQPFLSNIFIDMGGSVSGKFSVSGSTEGPVIKSDGARFNMAMVRPAVNQVSYTFDGPFELNQKNAGFHNMSITDGKGGSAVLNGIIKYEKFRDADLDINLEIDRLSLLDIPSGQGAPVSGNIAASGIASLAGRAGNLKATAELITSGPGLLDLTMGQGVNASTSSLLTFTSVDTVKLDPYIEMMNRLAGTREVASKSGISLKAGITVMPEIETRLELDPVSGSGLNARGNGQVNLSIQQGIGKPDFSGGYDITSGLFRFSIPGIVMKDFEIKEGSSIKFGGDLMNSDLDINAVYTTRAALSTLIQSDSSSTNTRRVVECGINISDKLRNPDLDLSININDLDPTTKSKVDGALNTEDKIQKQFVSLLILGTFMPDDPSGIVNGGNMILSNMDEILSSQFSNILKRLDIPLDLGFKYQQNANSGKEIFDVAISTQLFNDRVYVNGNLGNRNYGTNPNGGLVGDINIEIKLDDPGQLRLNLFSRSADEYTSYLDLSQRNGVGISFQKEYTSFKDLIRNMFSGKRKKEERKAIKDKSEENRTVISIGQDE